MCDRREIINGFYDSYDEETRMENSRQAQLEYYTTMHFIRKYLADKGKVIEVGAGTGRYSINLAKEGYDVTAVEFADRNFEILCRKCEEIPNIKACKGDGVDLHFIADNSFDMTLILGPLYHLYDRQDQEAAIKEAIRVTKKGGIIIAAFLSVHAIMFDNYLQGNFASGLEENFTRDYKVKHFPEQLFTGFNIDEFEELFTDMPVDKITIAAVDGIMELAERREDFSMSEAEFDAFKDYHLHHCQRVELLGSSSHLIYIARKK
ncbi:class I SAM-dependent methyltransferase [Butyrivibrio sp. NC3005]|uniref:class I SAM-dependent methyltransferase n=1 Tax=Butyrivibrio sp. NC3005 TaxID=1280685 RepID=UPI00041B5A5F|nr:class I SAM-dependent methyltransferase [Butyrivibrio sp. NC3005]